MARGNGVWDVQAITTGDSDAMPYCARACKNSGIRHRMVISIFARASPPRAARCFLRSKRDQWLLATLTPADSPSVNPILYVGRADREVRHGTLYCH